MINRDLEHLRYRLYARKSTDTEDKQVQSLDDQVKYMTELAKQEGLTIVGEPIYESKSALTPFKRPQFTALLQEIEDGKIDGIVTWKLDRLSRNPAENGLLQQMLQDYKIKHIRTNEDNHFPEDNAIIFSVKAGMSNQYSRDLSVNTKRGMRGKVERGDKPGVPPIGYLNNRLEKEPISNLHPPQTDNEARQVNHRLKHTLLPLPAVA